MCGIAGAVSLGNAQPSHAALIRMAASLWHRGPDDLGIEIHEGVGFAMRRLAVIDIEGGRQPQVSEDGQLCLMLNGEIYNFQELRRSLQLSGCQFRTSSDTEVVLQLWIHYGEAALAMLDGMFAVAVHDRRTGKVLLARDGAGIKPLYYYRDSRWLLFGSEIKALLAFGALQPTLNRPALCEFLAWEYVPGPNTLIQGIRRVMPGHFVEMDLHSGECRERSFWSLTWQEQGTVRRSDAEWAEQIDSLVGESVRKQLVSDVPVGALLSGGVDSSLVVARMGAARAFTIGFDAAGYDETIHARRVARHLGISHRVEIVSPEAAELFHQLMPFMDDPIADSSIFPTFLACRLARSEVTVALSGDGGDELFGGYEAYRAQLMSRWWGRLPVWLRNDVMIRLAAVMRPRPAKKGAVNKFRRFVAGAAEDPTLGHARWRMHAGLAVQQALFADHAMVDSSSGFRSHIDTLAVEAEGFAPRNRPLFIDFKSYLVDNCLAKVDRMSMACSLEVRVPLLDRSLIELAFLMPARLKYSILGGKLLLRKVARRYVPSQCVDRQKEGFSAPLKHWLNSSLKAEMDRLLDPEELRAAGLFNSTTVTRLRLEHANGVADRSHLLWAIMVFEDWRRRWRVGI